MSAIARHTVGVWAGNFDGMWEVSGVAGAALIWHDLMDYMHRQVASEAPTPPKGLLLQVVNASGKTVAPSAFQVRGNGLARPR